PWGLARKRSPHWPGIALALGLRACTDADQRLPRTTSGKELCIMSLPSLLRWLIGGVAANQRRRTQYPGRTAASRHSRLTLEQLEDRTLPSSYTAGSVVELIASINAANLAGGANTITLTAKTTFTLTAADNITDGATGLPVITANDILTINGNGDTLERSTT